MAGGHHLLEQRRRAVFRILKTFVEHFHHRQHGVEADHVGERQRTNRVIAAELHAGVDVLGAGDALLQGEDRFVDHRAQDAVDGEAGAVLGSDRHLADPLGEFHRLGVGIVGGLQAADQFEQRHQRHRIEEVHADEAVRAVCRGGEFRDRDRRGVGGDQRARLQRGAEVFENLDLEVLVLGRGLDHEVAIRKLRLVGGAGDALERCLVVGLAHLLLVDQPLQALVDHRKPLGDGGIGNVGHDNGQSGSRADLRDTVAHGAGADNANGFNHDLFAPVLRARCRGASHPDVAHGYQSGTAGAKPGKKEQGRDLRRATERVA